MSTDLYEILEVQTDATPEQSMLLVIPMVSIFRTSLLVRRAYKKRALQTHPDRASPSEKAQAEERFRQVRSVLVLHDRPPTQ